MKEQIPDTVIKLLSNIFAEKYSDADINHIFLYSGAPLENVAGKKSIKVKNWLRIINNDCNEPLLILGHLLKTFWKDNKYSYQEELHDCLATEGLRYSNDGKIYNVTDPFNTSLSKIVHKLNIQVIDTEITRALINVDADRLCKSLGEIGVIRVF